MRLIIIWLIIVSTVAAFGVASGASFNCAKAVSNIEKMICLDTQLSSLDDQLALEYKAAMQRDTQIKTIQLNWLVSVRNRCDTAQCLVSAYKDQLALLSGLDASVSQGESTPQANADVQSRNAEAASGLPNAIGPQAAISSIATLFNPQDFMSVASFASEFTSETFWSNPASMLYGKYVRDWTDSDFQVLERKLKEQIEVELALAKKRKLNLIAEPQQSGFAIDSSHQFRRDQLLDAISAVQKMPSWVANASAQYRAQIERDAQQSAIRSEATRQAAKMEGRNISSVGRGGDESDHLNEQPSFFKRMVSAVASFFVYGGFALASIGGMGMVKRDKRFRTGRQGNREDAVWARPIGLTGLAMIIFGFLIGNI